MNNLNPLYEYLQRQEMVLTAPMDMEDKEFVFKLINGDSIELAFINADATEATVVKSSGKTFDDLDLGIGVLVEGNGRFETDNEIQIHQMFDTDGEHLMLDGKAFIRTYAGKVKEIVSLQDERMAA